MDTIMAPMTPIQISPIVVLRVSGPQALDLLEFFSIKKIAPKFAARAAFASRINSAVSDEVLLLYFKAPASYTGEDVLEVSFHGNPLIVNQAMADFAARGVRMAEPGEFTRRAVLNGKLSVSQAEAVNALIHAPTDAGISSARRTLYGELDSIFKKLRGGLIGILAEIEASIDFAEELYELQTESVKEKLAGIEEKLEALLGSYKDAQRAVRGINVVITGAPNAGKSTLFNLLLGSDRAIVADEAGTTRDLLTEQLHMGSVHLSLTDTAGMRSSGSAAESEGVRRARSALKTADLALILVDMNASAPDETLALINSPEDVERLVIGTKADLPAAGNSLVYDIMLSSVDEKSIKSLKDRIEEKVKAMIPKGDFGAAILAETQRAECAESLAELRKIDDELPADLQAYHLKNAISALDRTQGVDLPEQVLDKVFSNFCIGK